MVPWRKTGSSNSGISSAAVMTLRLAHFRKQAADLKSTAQGVKENQQKVDDLTNAGDLAGCFQFHEQVHILSKKALALMTEIAGNTECNSILLNTLGSKMKAAGDIAEYEQAQVLKRAMEVVLHI